MYHQNIRDLPTNYESLCEILDSHRGRDIILLSETHTNENSEKLFAIQGYENIECAWVEIFVEKWHSFLICSLYRPLTSSKYLVKAFGKDFNEMVIKASTSQKEVIIMGDCNVNFQKNGDCDSFKSTLALKVQSWKLCNNKYIIASAQITNTQIFAW